MMFWGGTFVVGKLLSQNMSAYSAAFLRFAVASVCLSAIAYTTNKSLFKINRKHLLPLIFLGLTGIAAYNVFFFKGLRLIEANRASIIIAMCPSFIAIASAIFYKEKFSWFKVLGLIISFIGVAIVITRGHFTSLLNEHLGFGELFIFFCVLCWVIYTLIGKKLLQTISSYTAVMYASLFGMILLLPFAWANDLTEAFQKATLFNWIQIIYLGVFGTVLGFIWYYKGIQKIGSTKAGIFINLVPVNAIWIAALILKEPISLSLIAGGAFVIIGVYITNNL